VVLFGFLFFSGMRERLQRGHLVQQHQGQEADLREHFPRGVLLWDGGQKSSFCMVYFRYMKYSL
jgi:hypothetical protein